MTLPRFIAEAIPSASFRFRNKAGVFVYVARSALLSLLDGWEGNASERLAQLGYQSLLDAYAPKPFYSGPLSGNWTANILEHEWFAKGDGKAWCTPKIFIVDGKNVIWSSVDQGGSWKKEYEPEWHFHRQFSNIDKRLLVRVGQAGTYPNNKNGRLRIVDGNYNPIHSDFTGVFGCFGSDGADGKPGDSNTFLCSEYVSVPAGGHGGEGVRIYRTTDGGNSWQTVLLVTDVHHFHTCRFDPYNPTHAYATTGDGTGLNRWYFSDDSGATWTMISGGDINGGLTPLVGGGTTSGKYMRTTHHIMGVDTGPKGRNSMFHFHDNGPTSFVRYDKTKQKFQLISGDLEGVAYGSVLTEGGVFTITQTSTALDYDCLHYIEFPRDDGDIDEPEAYTVHTVKIPKHNTNIFQNFSRQVDIAGNAYFGQSISLNSDARFNLTNSRRADSIGMVVNLNWFSNDGDRSLGVQIKPLQVGR